jgi:hypothetical protein
MTTFLKTVTIMAALLIGSLGLAASGSSIADTYVVNMGEGDGTGKFTGDYSGIYTRIINGKKESLETHVSLERDGETIKGVFDLGIGKGTISNGRIEGNILYFTWQFAGMSGTGHLLMLHHGELLTGVWNGGYRSKGHAGTGTWKLYKE